MSDARQEGQPGPFRVEHLKPGDRHELSNGHAYLENDVPVVALYDRERAHELTLKNLLERRAYESEEGREEGAARAALAGLRAVLAARGFTPTAAHEVLLSGERSLLYAAHRVDSQGRDRGTNRGCLRVTAATDA